MADIPKSFLIAVSSVVFLQIFANTVFIASNTKTLEGRADILKEALPTLIDHEVRISTMEVNCMSAPKPKMPKVKVNPAPSKPYDLTHKTDELTLNEELANRVPSNWVLERVGENRIRGINSVTGSVFEGSFKVFSEYLHTIPDRGVE